MSLYSQRGVSAQKEDVHKATSHLDKGLYPHAFCKIYPDHLGEDAQWVNLMHADGAGTKSVLAYLYWKETGDLSVWRGIAQDAIAMNLDDLLCVGVTDNLLFSSTIDRNKKLIPGEVLQEIISGSQQFLDNLRKFGINIHYLGGETADVGDVVRTIAVNGTMTARWPKSKLITNDKISANDLVIGIASYGRTVYESDYNSGIGSNGLTSARHDILHAAYADNYPETYEPSLDREVVYIGSHTLSDRLDPETPVDNVGRLLLSPTRTYAPFVRQLLEEQFDGIHGMVHCSGGGQTKCMKYMPGTFRVVKDNLFEPPLIFRLIREASGADNREMYQVFNMGHRLEIFTREPWASHILALAASFGMDARIVGHVENASKAELVLKVGDESIIY